MSETAIALSCLAVGFLITFVKQSLHAALEDQGRELRHHFDHALALAVGGLRQYVEERFDTLGTEMAVVTRMVTRLDRVDGDRRVNLDLLDSLRTLERRVDVLERRLGDGPLPAGGPATTPSPPPAP